MRGEIVSGSSTICNILYSIIVRELCINSKRKRKSVKKV